MNDITRLKKRFALERAIYIIAILATLFAWHRSVTARPTYAVNVNNKQVACLVSETDAKAAVEEAKKSAGLDPADIEFKENVEVKKAPGTEKTVDTKTAVKAILGKVTLRTQKWTVTADGKPVVAFATEKEAVDFLDRAKMRFAEDVKYLAEEPQFKEKIAAQEMGVNPAFVKRSVNEGLEFVFDRPNEPTASGTGIHVVKKGEVASKIAARYGTTVKEMKKLNGPKNLAKLRIGDKIVVAKPEEDGNKKDPAKPAKLTVIVRDQRESVERIPPEVIKVSSGQMYAGKTYVISPGKAGKRRIKTAAVYENGVKKSTEVLEEEILTKPVPRQIAIGIKPRR